MFMPFIGSLFYFSTAPRYFSTSNINTKLTVIFVLTIMIPLLIFYFLKRLKIITSIHLVTTRQRIIPLTLNVLILLLIVQHIIPINEFNELYYFFIGALLSTITCLILAFLKFKASIHMAAIAGILMFFIAISINYNIHIINIIILVFVANGAIAMSRIHVNAHNYIELIIGFFIGLIPQLILVNYWL